MTNDEFWIKRNTQKILIKKAERDLKNQVDSESTLSDEEKIYVRQAIDWLQYVQKRHPVNDEKLLKKYPV